MSVVTSSSPATTALLTDHYELTMVQAARHAGTADRRSVFELFPRRLPEGRRYGVVAGVGRALDAIETFRFDPPALAMLEGVVERWSRLELAGPVVRSGSSIIAGIRAAPLRLTAR